MLDVCVHIRIAEELQWRSFCFIFHVWGFIYHVVCHLYSVGPKMDTTF